MRYQFNRTCVEIADIHKKQKEITQCISRKMDSHEYLTENKKLADRILALNLEMECYKLDLCNVEKNHTPFINTPPQIPRNNNKVMCTNLPQQWMATSE